MFVNSVDRSSNFTICGHSVDEDAVARKGPAHERAAAQLTDHKFISALGSLDPRRKAGTLCALDVDVVGDDVTGQRSDKDKVRDGNR